MDGNGRWATRKHLPRVMGHRKGAEALKKLIEGTLKRRIPYLTVYAFSSENWARPAAEVKNILTLFEHYLVREEKKMFEHDIRLRVIGSKEKLPDRLRTYIQRLEDLSQQHKTLTLQVAFSYGGRQEILRAAKQAALDLQKGLVSAEDLNEAHFNKYLYTANVPDPDLLIRTGGEKRLSNYLLWQLAYAEFVFSDTLWPDFSAQDLDEALHCYRKRQRRFGQVPKTSFAKNPEFTPAQALMNRA